MSAPPIASGAAPRVAAATLAPFRHRLFLAVWVASLVSNFGNMAQAVGASWLMTSIADSSETVALVQTATSLPILLFSLAAGAIADIWSRRSVMLLAQSLMLAVSAALAGLTFAGAITPAILLGFTFALGVGAALYGPAWQSSVGEQVPRSDVPAAVALNSLSFNIARALGPALGGAIVAAAGAQAAFLFNAVSYVGLIAVLATWRPPPPERTLPPESMGPAMAAGLRYAWQSPVIRTVLVRAFAFGICGGALWALLPLVARHLVGGGPLTYGVLLGGFGAGAILGALSSASLRRRLSSEILVRGGTLAFGLSAVATALIPAVPLLVPVLMAGGAAWVLVLSTLNITVQMSAPRWVLGRALAVYQMVTFGGLAGGSWFWGAAADHAGLGPSLAASGAAMLATLALALRFRLPAAEAPDLEPSHAWPEPAVALAFDPRSGPVLVTVEYRVARENAAAFLAAMQALRRIRRRDGARRWELAQDVTDPELWLESFHAPTWLEHLRQHQRATVADRAAEARVLALHAGPEPPRVRHLLQRSAMPSGDTAAAIHD